MPIGKLHEYIEAMIEPKGLLQAPKTGVQVPVRFPEVEILETTLGSALLLIEETTYDINSNAIEYTPMQLNTLFAVARRPVHRLCGIRTEASASLSIAQPFASRLHGYKQVTKYLSTGLAIKENGVGGASYRDPDCWGRFVCEALRFGGERPFLSGLFSWLT